MQLTQHIIKTNYKNFIVFYNGKDNDDYQNNDNFCCVNSKNSKGGGIIDNEYPEKYQYYYHSDHLGSASYITNLDGDIVQHIEYVPFGEVFLEERNNKWNTPYLFNGKELDEETGLYYYGARYYTSREGIWLSVDPLLEEKPQFSPYNFCSNNPVVRVDPDGMLDTRYEDEYGNLIANTNDGNNNKVVIKEEYKKQFKEEYTQATKVGTQDNFTQIEVQVKYPNKNHNTYGETDK